MPLLLWTTLLRLANLKNSADPGGKTDGVVRGMAGRGEGRGETS
jgi:hypothetical protein